MLAKTHFETKNYKKTNRILKEALKNKKYLTDEAEIYYMIGIAY